MFQFFSIKTKYRISNFIFKILETLRVEKRSLISTDFRAARANSRAFSLSPSYFDGEFYCDAYPDVAASGTDPFVHFFLHGILEGRKARFFNPVAYAKAYPDVAALGNDSHNHFLQYGKEENRQAFYVYFTQDEVLSRRTHYSDWLKAHSAILQLSKSEQRRRLAMFKRHPLISVVMPVYNPPVPFLVEAIESVIRQSYPNWELCIADDCSTNPEIRTVLEEYKTRDNRIRVCFRDINGHISEASNSALGLATGEYVALLDHDDILPEDALFWVGDAIDRFPALDVIYSDEDKIDEMGRRFDPYFKSDFNYELFLAQNMVSHLGVYRRALVERVGGFRRGYEGSQDHDLALRVVEQTFVDRIHHIPRVLYHWRAIAGSTAVDVSEKSYATQAGVKAVRDHLKRIGVDATVDIADAKIGHYRVQYALRNKDALVSIIIPTRDRLDLLRVAVESIFSNTTYKKYEIVIIDNGSIETDTLEYFAYLKGRGVKIVRDDLTFNFSRLVNIGVKESAGEYIVLLNNDIEIITDRWLEELVSFAQMKDIGCVGARLWYPDRTIQHAGVVLGMGGVAGHVHKHLDAGSKGYFCRAVHHQSFSAVTAACVMVRRDVFGLVGGFDESLAVAFNDVDFCLKVVAAGYRNIWTPYAEMVHHESASRGEETTPEKQRRFQAEVDAMIARWGEKLYWDPAYNPNLSLDHTDFSLAWPPRLVSERVSSIA
ncbi:glycosyltransferase family 2 protein [Asticcacaulis sp. DW145]|uniref:glycosyltransferase family 2 protein n=1 Tax=Asticcacaulis sp. DW145 TaxID=3095608 RepID=UPI0030847F09|nr:glycosyltransferase family 2 protein [Asticcacaulis sp. DW145]